MNPKTAQMLIGLAIIVIQIGYDIYKDKKHEKNKVKRLTR